MMDTKKKRYTVNVYGAESPEEYAQIKEAIMELHFAVSFFPPAAHAWSSNSWDTMERDMTGISSSYPHALFVVIVDSRDSEDQISQIHYFGNGVSQNGQWKENQKPVSENLLVSFKDWEKKLPMHLRCSDAIQITGHGGLVTVRPHLDNTRNLLGLEIVNAKGFSKYIEVDLDSIL